MKINKQTQLVLAHAVLWGWLMISIAYFNPSKESANTILIFLVSGWFISQSILMSAIKHANHLVEANNSNKETQCLNRMLNTKKKDE